MPGIIKTQKRMSKCLPNRSSVRVAAICKPNSASRTVSCANGKAATDFLEALGPDIIITHATSILAPSTFAIARQAALNIHCGILPAYRGHDSTFWAMYDGAYERVA